MSNRRITKTFIRHVVISFALMAIGSFITGYAVAPSRPYLFVHMPTGGFLGQYSSMSECRAARRAFGSGRNIPTYADIAISAKPQGYIDLCTRDLGDGTGVMAGTLNAGL